MSLDNYRKALAIIQASTPSTAPDREQMALALTTSHPRNTYNDIGDVLTYVLNYGAWVKENKLGEPVLINGIQSSLAQLSSWDDTWPSQLMRGKDILDADIVDALEWLDACGGRMAQESLPLAKQLLQRMFATEGPLDKFGRKTLVATTAPVAATPPAPAPDPDDPIVWFHDMPDASVQKTRAQVLGIVTRIRALGGSPPVPYKPPCTAKIIESGLLDVDSDPADAHSGFILCNPRTYADLRKNGGTLFDMEVRDAYHRAGIPGRALGAVIITRPYNEMADGYLIFADPDVCFTITYIPDP